MTHYTDYLVDSSAYSRYRSRRSGDVQAKLAEATSLAVNAVVVGELLAGFRHGSRREENELELRRFLGMPGLRVLPLTEPTAAVYAEIWAAQQSRGRPLPTNDLWVAASALEHDLAVLSADRHFLEIPGLQVEMLD